MNNNNNNRGAPYRGNQGWGHRRQSQRPQHHPPNPQFQRGPVYQHPEPEGVQGHQGNPNRQELNYQPPFQRPPPGYGNPQGYYPPHEHGGVQGYQGNPNRQQNFYQPPFQRPPPGYGNPQGYYPPQEHPHHAPRSREPLQFPRGPRSLAQDRANQRDRGSPYPQRLVHQIPPFLPPPQFVVPQVPPFPVPNLQQMEHLANHAVYPIVPIQSPNSGANAVLNLDRLPDPSWGTEEQKSTTLADFDMWRRNNRGVQGWLGWNILMMNVELFKSTIVDDQMVGIYKFSAYVKMFNWMSWREEQRRHCMQWTYLPPPDFEPPQVIDLEWFREPRTNHQYLEVNEELARRFLDQEHEWTQNLYEKFNSILREIFTPDTAHWIAANILGENSDAVLRNGWVANTERRSAPVNRRMRNWMTLHPSWRSDFMNLANVAFTREADIWDPNNRRNLGCLEDSPTFNPNLCNYMNRQLASGYLREEPDCPFSVDQTTYLYYLWVRKNLRHRRWGDQNIVRNHYGEIVRMKNWLRLHADWKEIIIIKWNPQ